VGLRFWGLRFGGEVSRVEKMLYVGTDPESYITEYTSVYEDTPYPPPVPLKAAGATRKPLTFEPPRPLVRNYQPKILNPCP